MELDMPRRDGERQGLTADERWNAIVRRDRAADSRFVYAVRTTGVYCRPSCAARRPKPENIAYYATAGDAQRAGFRACKRCRPDDASGDAGSAPAVARACRLIETAEQPPLLQELADAAGLSASHFHRTFKAVVGVTPKAYAEHQRVRRMQRSLRDSSRVTDAIYDAGFSSNSRFYERADRMLGMTPTQYRNGGAATRIRFALAQCSLGAVLVAATDRGICAILLGDDPGTLLQDMQERFPNADLLGGEDAFEGLVARVVAVIERPRLPHDLPLDIRGTAFQQRVWEALREIPPGETTTYTQIAERIGSPRAVRAVAAACAANPLAVAVPCHRVVRLDGDLAGYRWGLARKKQLLEREREEAVG